MITMKASAIAHSNIALVKYWGKRDEELILPYNSSLSMTTDRFFTHTTVEFSDSYKKDQVIINGKEYLNDSKEYTEYVGKFLKIIRAKLKSDKSKLKAKIASFNNFPTAAGLASSASSFAALAVAVDKALGMNLSRKELSILARQGSGSASRSVFGGFVEWKKGQLDNGSDSYSEQFEDEEFWPNFRMIVCITSLDEKKHKSRPGMKLSIATSPFFRQWSESCEEDLKLIKKGIKLKDIEQVGIVAESNCLKMHSVMWTTKPAIIYQNPTTIKLMHMVMSMREQGLKCYFTMDAGPQVKILCLEKDVDAIKAKLTQLRTIKAIIVTKPGKGAVVVEKHLF